MWHALEQAFVDIPIEEGTSGRSRLRPRFSANSGFIASPIEFPLFPRAPGAVWEMELGSLMVPRPAPLEFVSDETKLPSYDKGTVYDVITIIREGTIDQAAQGTEPNITYEVEVRLSDVMDSSCKRSLKSTHEQLAAAVEESVASCAIALVLLDDASNAVPLFAEAYDLLTTLDDPEQLAHVIHGVEMYQRFMDDPSSSNARHQDLDTARHAFHAAIELDPTYGTALAQYLYAHVLIASRGYDNRIPSDQLSHALTHAKAAFETHPFSGPEYLWNKTLMLEASDDPSSMQEAQEFWTGVLDPKGTSTAAKAPSIVIPMQVPNPEIQARSRLAAIHRASMDFPAAIVEHAILEQSSTSLDPEMQADVLVESGVTSMIVALMASEARHHTATLAIKTFAMEVHELFDPIVAAYDTSWPNPPGTELIHACDDQAAGKCDELRTALVKFLEHMEALLYDHGRSRLLRAYRLYRDTLQSSCEALASTNTRTVVLPKACGPSGQTTQAHTASAAPTRMVPERRIEELQAMMTGVSEMLAFIGCRGTSTNDCMAAIEDLFFSPAIDSPGATAKLAAFMIYQVVEESRHETPQSEVALVPFVFFPPDSEEVDQLRKQLSSLRTDTAALKQTQRLLDYADLWPTLARYAKLRRNGARHRTAVLNQTLIRVSEAGQDREALREALEWSWDALASSDDGREYNEIVLRVETLSRRRDDDAHDRSHELELTLQKRIEHARQSYQEWLTDKLLDATTRRARRRLAKDAVAMAGRIRASADQHVHDDLLHLTKEFIEQSSESFSRASSSLEVALRIAVLRTISRARMIGNRRAYDRLVMESLALLLLNESNELQDVSRRGLGWLKDSSVAFDVARVPLQRHITALLKALNDQELPRCRSYSRSTVRHNTERCLHRFLLHVALNQQDYAPKDSVLDITREDASDYLSAFHAWASAPMSPGHPAVAFWWMVQDDKVDGGVNMARLLHTSRSPVFRAFARNVIRKTDRDRRRRWRQRRERGFPT